LGDSAMPPKPWVPQSTAEVVVAGLEQLFAKEVRLRMAGFSFGGQIAGLSAAALGGRGRSFTGLCVAAPRPPPSPPPPFSPPPPPPAIREATARHERGRSRGRLPSESGSFDVRQPRQH